MILLTKLQYRQYKLEYNTEQDLIVQYRFITFLDYNNDMDQSLPCMGDFYADNPSL